MIAEQTTPQPPTSSEAAPPASLGLQPGQVTEGGLVIASKNMSTDSMKQMAAGQQPALEGQAVTAPNSENSSNQLEDQALQSEKVPTVAERMNQAVTDLEATLGKPLEEKTTPDEAIDAFVKTEVEANGLTPEEATQKLSDFRKNLMAAGEVAVSSMLTGNSATTLIDLVLSPKFGSRAAAWSSAASGGERLGGGEFSQGQFRDMLKGKSAEFTKALRELFSSDRDKGVGEQGLGSALSTLENQASSPQDRIKALAEICKKLVELSSPDLPEAQQVWQKTQVALIKELQGENYVSWKISRDVLRQDGVLGRLARGDSEMHQELFGQTSDGGADNVVDFRQQQQQRAA